MKTFLTDRTTLAYLDEGSGPAIVFLHNGGTSSTIWREQCRDLAPDHRVVAIDLPGFGASPLPRPAITLDEMVDLVAALIGDLDIAPVTMVGNCMGSNISVNLARKRPDLVSGVLAVNPLTAASFAGGGIGFTHTMKRLAAGPARMVRSVSRRVGVPGPGGPVVLRFQLGPKGVAKGLHHDPELLACQVRPDQMPALVDVLDDMDAYGDLDTALVDDPVTIWVAWGAQNKILSRTRAEGLAGKLHAARVEVIEGTGHLVMLEDPATITGLIRELVGATTLQVVP